MPLLFLCHIASPVVHYFPITGHEWSVLLLTYLVSLACICFQMRNNSRDALYMLLLFIFKNVIPFLAAPSDSKAALQSKIVAEFVVSSEPLTPV